MSFWKRIFGGGSGVPAGTDFDPLVAALLSPDLERREPALQRARRLAQSGDPAGVLALERAIRAKSGDPRCDLYEPGLALRTGEQMLRAREELLELAERGALCREARRAGTQIAMLMTMDLSDPEDVGALLDELERRGGPDALHEFQLLGTHGQALAGLRKARGEG